MAADPSPPVLDEAGRQQVVRAVRRLCPSWLASERDDIVQITMLRLHQTMGASEGKAPLASSYVWKTAYTVMVDEIRRRARRPEAPLDPAAHDVARSDPSPEELATGKQLGLAIRDCLANMVPARKAAAVLHLQGHTVPEIARLMQWDGKKADNLVYRALADLRMCLTSKGLKP